MRRIISTTTVLTSWALTLAAVLPSVAVAQTLTDPNPRPAASSRPAVGKAVAKHMKACPEYGAGFYRLDGTGACVKIGGFVEAGVSSGH